MKAKHSPVYGFNPLAGTRTGAREDADERSCHRISDEASGQDEVRVLSASLRRTLLPLRPYRESYNHDVCGQFTTMAPSIAETWAVDPTFYTGTYCAPCNRYRPVGEFCWYPDGEPLGS